MSKLFKSKQTWGNLALILIISLLLFAYQNCSSSDSSSSDSDQDGSNIVTTLFADDTSSKSILEGNGVTFRVDSSALSLWDPVCSEPTYQWSFSANGVGSYSNISDATNSTYIISATSTIDDGQYRVSMTCDGITNTLGPATLEVVETLVIESSNINGVTTNLNSNHTFTVTASGPTPITYQWYFTPTGGSRVAISGATSDTLEINGAQNTDEGFYDVSVSSSEGGVEQTISLGPAQLDVNGGDVAGSLTISPPDATFGDPVNMSVNVTGTVSPTYQWYKDNLVISGATSTTYSIASADFDDAGEYHLVVTDLSQNYIIGPGTLSVTCPSGQTQVSGSCLENQVACTDNNGSGYEYLQSDGTYTTCTLSSCDISYTYLSNTQTCVLTTGSCNIENGTGTYTDGDESTCVVDSCDQFYEPSSDNKSCVPQSCEVTNGDGAYENGVCVANSCDTDFVVYDGECVAQFQSCTIENGTGSEEWDSDGPIEDTCKAISCDTNYFLFEDRCVSNECPVTNGTGHYEVDSDGNLSCEIDSCDTDYVEDTNNSCINEDCEPLDGTGVWVNTGSSMVCDITSCDDGYTELNNICIEQTCFKENATETQFSVDDEGNPVCTATECETDFFINSDGDCELSTIECTLDNGTGLKNEDGECVATECDEDYTVVVGVCATTICEPDNGTGHAEYDTTTGAGVCVVDSCDSGYTESRNTCYESRIACEDEITNARTAYKNFDPNRTYDESMENDNMYGKCELSTCISGYTANLSNDECLASVRFCPYDSSLVQIATSTGYGSCVSMGCASDESVIIDSNNNAFCVPNVIQGENGDECLDATTGTYSPCDD